MNDLAIFHNIDLADIDKMISCFNAQKKSFIKDDIILSDMVNNNLVGIMLSGNASMIRDDYNGNRTLLENLEYNSIFGKYFSYLDNEVSIVANTDCEVLFIEYNHLIKRCNKNCLCHELITNNVLELLSRKIVELNERIEILSKRTIKEKVLSYLDLLARKKGKNSFYLPLSYTELANYLSIDRSAMMREIKKLKEEGLITNDGKKLTIC